MELDLLNESVITGLIQEIESEEIKDRREAEYTSYKICNGAQYEYIKKELLAKYPESHNTMTLGDICIGRKVINKISKAYKDSPIRTLESDIDTEVYNKIAEEGNWQVALQDFDRDYNRQRYGLLWVNNIEEKITLHSLKGYESFTIINNNTGKLELVCLNYPDNTITRTNNPYNNSDGVEQHFSDSQDDSSANTRIYVFWTDELHVVYEVVTSKGEKNERVQTIRLVAQENNPSNRNPIGKIPFVFKSKSTSADLPFMNNLGDQSVTWNVHFSEYLTSASAQGFGQLVVKMPEGAENKEIHTGRTTAIQLLLRDGEEQQPDAFYINANPNLAEQNESLQTFAEGILGDYGISSGILANEKFNSGFERVIAQADVQDLVTENQNIYSTMEQEIFDIVVAYSKVIPNMKVFKEQKITIIFQKPKVLISDKETLENIKTRMELGLITKAEALMILDPNLDESKADEKLLSIDQERQANINSLSGLVDGEDTETN